MSIAQSFSRIANLLCGDGGFGVETRILQRLRVPSASSPGISIAVHVEKTEVDIFGGETVPVELTSAVIRIRVAGWWYSSVGLCYIAVYNGLPPGVANVGSMLVVNILVRRDNTILQCEEERSSRSHTVIVQHVEIGEETS